MTDTKISPAQLAFNALSIIMSHRPFFESHAKHIESHNAFDVILGFIREKFDEEQKFSNITENLVGIVRQEAVKSEDPVKDAINSVVKTIENVEV